jgi:hypothetical protein
LQVKSKSDEGCLLAADLKDLRSGLTKIASWMLALSKGVSAPDFDMDPMDRVDNVPLLLGRIIDLLNEFLQFPNAQVPYFLS